MILDIISSVLFLGLASYGVRYWHREDRKVFLLVAILFSILGFLLEFFDLIVHFLNLSKGVRIFSDKMGEIVLPIIILVEMTVFLIYIFKNNGDRHDYR
jgi:hypothetical protein